MFRGGEQVCSESTRMHEEFILNCGSQFSMFPLGSYASEDVPSRCDMLLSIKYQLLAVLCSHLGYLLVFRFDSNYLAA